MRWWPMLLLTTVLLVCGPARGDEASSLFPFVLPWDDASPVATDVRAWLPKPAGARGPVHPGGDGHLFVGDRRIRFLGVNLCFSGNFPGKDDAGKVAARMARFGINVVRFHHMDMFPFPQGIRARQATGTGDLDPETLERLDFFISQFEQQGIYANLNLLVSRPFDHTDGLPADVERVDWKDRHVLGFFHRPILRLQQEYARKLLTHRNPHTGQTYAEDPGVAFVEINNENGLIHAWLGRQVDRLPDVFLRDLQRQWNAWLAKRHGTTEKLRQAWGVQNEAPGAELLSNVDFARGTDHWTLERHEQAAAAVTVTDDLPKALRSGKNRSARIEVTRTSSMGWHVQFNQSGIKLQAERPCTLTFWARAEQPLTIAAEVGQAHEPWKNLGLNAEIKLTEEWQPFRFVFLPNATDDNARVDFSNLAQQKTTVGLAGVSFRPGGALGLAAQERLEDGSVPVFARARFGERTREGQRDWLRFLWETEDAYWQAMQRFLKDEVKVRGVVVGTIVGCSTPNLMARFDAVDTHAYWQHPHFPHRQWDADDWVVNNRSMVNEAGGVLPGLALRRVLGKPHTVTEYNHAAPNTFGSEGLLLLTAYGALQDWDALYAFAYSHSGDWNSRRISGFFDIDQHPTRMATLPAAAALFLRGDVQAAREQIAVAFDREREVEALRGAGPWELVHAGTMGVPRATALLHRIALVTEGEKPPENAATTTVALPRDGRYASDTRELLWDLSTKGRGVVTINTARSKGVIGYGGGKRFDLGGVLIEPGATRQDGWSTVTVTALAGDLTQGPARLLVTATGLAENTGMRWKSAAHDSVGRNWGKAPSLVEGIPVRLTFPTPPARLRAWALDEHGQRRDALSVGESAGKAVLDVGPRQRTLWYEIEVQ